MSPTKVSGRRFSALGGKEIEKYTINPGKHTSFGDGRSAAIRVECREDDSATLVTYEQRPRVIIKRESGEEEKVSGGVFTQELKPGEEIIFPRLRGSFRIRHEA